MPRRGTFGSSFCEILVVGNELLSGKTLDTNSHWITGQITQLGGKVNRKVTVPDDLTLIRAAVRAALKRKPKLLITIGGLGPTYDDKTVKGISLATRRPLRVNAAALRMVKAHYRAMHHSRIELTAHRIKMATLPAGATPLRNPIGTAPGIKLVHGATTIFALPGVPSEMKAIFSRSIVPYIKQKTSGHRYFEFGFRLLGVMESELAPLLDDVSIRFPNVYVKSHPQGFERRKHSALELHFSTHSRSPATGEQEVMKAVAFLLREIADLQPRAS